MTVCRLIQDLPAGGAWNMAVDEVLLARVGASGPVLRLYQWSPATLSLGFFQAHTDRKLHPPTLSCPVVRRPSGGGAILHDRELTYALVLPLNRGQTGRQEKLYFAVHKAVIRALSRWGCKAELVGVNEAKLGVGQVTTPCERFGADRANRENCLPRETLGCGAELAADVSALAHAREGSKEPFMCFARRSCGDVVIGPHKIAGSAQRRVASGILQHGSILLGQSPYAPEFPGVCELLGREIPAEELAQAFVQEIAEALGVTFVTGQMTESELSQARQLVAAKYGNPSWTQRR
ncbi:MAG: hypothetical protein NZ899_11700 [Thermoguttaceae bacterium]|nr:hypothetical protein [Thermoguttaceae bacterium]MDW8079387.1 hypothetical protein [Thermoguttaceae bacterium]